MSGPVITRSSNAWVQAALADVSTLLVDHAHCERKAAQTALKFAQHHPERPRMALSMSRLAREELVHYERVMAELKARGIPFGALASARYAQELFALGRKDHEGRQVDELLICALIEARSHERFLRLIEALTDERLRDLYIDLGEAEERHGELYVELAEEVAGAARAGEVAARLAELSSAEDGIVHRARQPLRMHAGG